MKSELFSIVIFLFFVASCGSGSEILEYEEMSFNSLAHDIIEQKRIKSMDDFSRTNKAINGVPIKLTEKDKNQDAQDLKKVIIFYSLDEKMISNLQSKLHKTRLCQFECLGDSILFTADGMLDTSWGYMYSRDTLAMDSAWFDFNGRSVRYNGNINPHWKKVVIK